MPQVLRLFRARHPGVALTVGVMNTGAQVSALRGVASRPIAAPAPRTQLLALRPPGAPPPVVTRFIAVVREVLRRRQRRAPRARPTRAPRGA